MFLHFSICQIGSYKTLAMGMMRAGNTTDECGSSYMKHLGARTCVVSQQSGQDIQTGLKSCS